MIYYKFKLGNFFCHSQKSYFFIDGVIKHNNYKKNFIYETFFIPESTYRTNRAKENSKQQYHKEILNYFKFNDIKNINQIELEETLGLLYHAIYYYNLDHIKKYRDKLILIIEKNTIISPILLLFQTISNIMINKKLSDLDKNTIKYLSAFPKKYFGDEFYYFYKVLYLMSLNKNDLQVISDKINCYEKHKWLYYHISALINYSRKDFFKSIAYYKFALPFYFNSFNNNRIKITIANMAYIFDIIGSFELAIDLLDSYLGDVLENPSMEMYSYILSIAIYSNFMLDRISEVLDLLNLIDYKYFKINQTFIVILVSIINNNSFQVKSIRKIIDRSTINVNLTIKEIIEINSLNLLNDELVKALLKKINLDHILKSELKLIDLLNNKLKND